MPLGWIYSSSSTWQKIKVTIEVIVMLRSIARTESHLYLKLPTDFVAKVFRPTGSVTVNQ